MGRAPDIRDRMRRPENICLSVASSEQPPGLPDILVEVEFGSEADGISLPLQDVHEIVKCVNNVLLMLAPFDR